MIARRTVSTARLDPAFLPLTKTSQSPREASSSTSASVVSLTLAVAPLPLAIALTMLMAPKVLAFALTAVISLSGLSSPSSLLPRASPLSAFLITFSGASFPVQSVKAAIPW